MDEKKPHNAPRLYFQETCFQMVLQGPPDLTAPEVEERFFNSPWGKRYRDLLAELYDIRDSGQSDSQVGGVKLVDVTHSAKLRRIGNEVERLETR
jgi:hypothetical protein